MALTDAIVSSIEAELEALKEATAPVVEKASEPVVEAAPEPVVETAPEAPTNPIIAMAIAQAKERLARETAK
jgi:hypothetical protein